MADQLVLLGITVAETACVLVLLDLLTTAQWQAVAAGLEVNVLWVSVIPGIIVAVLVCA